MPPIFQESPEDEEVIFQRVNARAAQQAMAREQATPGLAFRTAELANAYGATNLPPGAIVSLAREGIRPGDPAAEALARRAATRDHTDGFMDAVSGAVTGAAGGMLTALKGTTRTAFTIFESAMDELVMRPFRTTVGTARDLNQGSEGFDTLDTAGQLLNPAGAGAALGAAVGSGQRDDLTSTVSRNFGQAGESVGVSALRQIDDPGGVDLGSGFFPGGTARQASLESNQLRFRGEPISPGRFLGGYVTEPGTTPYKMASGMIDAAAQIAFDPANVVLAGGSNIAKARRAFNLPGEIRHMDDVRRTFGVAAGSHRSGVDTPYFVDRFLNQEKAGRQLKDHLAGTTDAEEIWEVLGRTPNRDLIARIRDNDDPIEVGDLLSEALGLTVRERPTGLVSAKLKASPIPGVNRSLRDLRILDEIPGRAINVENPDETLETFVQYAKNANLPSDTRKALASRYMDLQAGDHQGALDLAGDMMDEIGATISAKGGNPAVARSVTRLFDNWAEETRAYFVDEIGQDVPVLGATRNLTRNGETVPIPVKTPHLTTELLDRSIPLPDFREIRRATSNPAVRGFLDSGLGRLTTGVLEKYMRIWKPLQLLRAAWTVRVIGEEQVRLGGAGLDSPFRHPASFLGWLISEDNRHLGRIAKGERDVFGNPLGVSDQHHAAMSSRASAWLGEPGERVVTGDYVRYSRQARPARGIVTDDDTFIDMWSDELRQLWNDEVSSRVARGSDFTFTNAKTGEELVGTDAVKEWFWSSERGHQIRRMFAEGANNPESAKWALVDEGMARRVGDEMGWPVDDPISVEGLSITTPAAGPLGPHSASRRASDHYIDTVADRIAVKTSNDPELVDAIATGRLEGLDLRNLDPPAMRKLRKALGDRIDAAPDVVKGPRLMSGTRVSRLDRFVETMFDHLMGTPTNKLSRSPAFRQFYAQRVAELAPRTPRSLSDDIQRWADDNNLSGAHIPPDLQVGTAEHIAIESMEELDVIAKQFALDETRKLLYDMDRRGQFFDIARNIIPFGEAWKEVIGTWSRLLAERPQNIRRFQQVVEGARGDEEGQGFFYTDPTTGEEMFNYPLVGRAMSAILDHTPGLPGMGDRAGLTARGQVQGLNLVSSSLLPGLQPMAAVAASKILADTPDIDWLRDALLPFGEENPSGIGDLVEEGLLPAWAKRIETAIFDSDQSSRLFANTRMSLVQGMVSSGDYDPSEIQQAVRDSAKPAKLLYFLRGLAQFALPTGPNVQHDLKDDDGRWHGAQVLAQEFRDMADEAGSYDAATARFVDRFGLDPLLISQSRTRTVAKRSFDPAGWEWERDHQDKRKVAPTTLGYFAPIGDPERDEFEYQAYQDAIRGGSSIPLTAEQQAAAYNNQVGWSEYRRFKGRLDRLDVSAEDRAIVLGELRAGLKVMYPGFDSISQQLPSKPPTDVLIGELEGAVQDPVLGETEAGKGIARYLELRSQAEEMADGVGLGGKRDVILRRALHTLGKQIARDNPDFSPVWMEVLSREVDDVEPFPDPPESTATAATS